MSYYGANTSLPSVHPSGVRALGGFSYVRVTGTSGVGSGASNKIQRFTTTQDNVGTDIVYVSDSVNGDSWTVNSAGIYAISVSMSFSTGANWGLSKSYSVLTNSIFSVPDANRLAYSNANGSDALNHVAVTVVLVAGDVIRVVGDGSATPPSPARPVFIMTKVL